MLDLSNDATKKELKYATDIYTSDLVAKKDFIALKPEVYKLDINRLTNGPNNLKTRHRKKTQKADTGIIYVLSWKSKGVFSSILKLLYTTFLNSIKFSEYMIGINFDKDPLAVEQNKYLTKIVNIYIVDDLDT